MKGDTLSHWNKKHEDSRDSTTILVSGLGSYRFTRVPMGGKTSGAALQSLEGLSINEQELLCMTYYNNQMRVAKQLVCVPEVFIEPLIKSVS